MTAAHYSPGNSGGGNNEPLSQILRQKKIRSKLNPAQPHTNGSNRLLWKLIFCIRSMFQGTVIKHAACAPHDKSGSRFADKKQKMNFGKELQHHSTYQSWFWALSSKQYLKFVSLYLIISNNADIKSCSNNTLQFWSHNTTDPHQPHHYSWSQNRKHYIWSL